MRELTTRLRAIETKTAPKEAPAMLFLPAEREGRFRLSDPEAGESRELSRAEAVALAETRGRRPIFVRIVEPAKRRGRWDEGAE